ncbi:MAG TPA: glycosyltransferase [Phycisphaerales bacterium]|nr:glycosyltransferase [Phycisphaerales bacterium]
MRILHISTRLILGGSQENTVLSCEGQARLGHEVHLAFGPIYGPEGSLLQRVEAFNERCARGEERTGAGEPCRPIGVHVVPSLVRELSPLRDPRAFGELKRLIDRLKPDVVHTHSSKAGILGRAAGAALAREGMAICHTIHGPPFMPVEGGAVRRAKIRLKNRIYTVAERFAARRCHVIISVADAMTEQFLARGIGRESQYVTVRSGMETGSFLVAAPGEDRASVRRELGLDERDFVIGTVARLAEHKGHDDILDALGDDLRGHPDWKLLWVGDGWWGDRLRARVRAMGLADRLVTTGLVPNERVPAMMRAMDVLVHPSYREGLPRTVPQALLAGVTPIAYDVDGTREVCRTGETGVLVPPADRAGLRSAVLGMYERPDERARLAAFGRAECAREFAAERMVAELENVYARALRSARAASARRPTGTLGA